MGRTVAKPIRCADCGRPAAGPQCPPDGWQLEDDRTVCNACCVADTKRLVQALITTTTDTAP
jgi:hypothetical protein